MNELHEKLTQAIAKRRAVAIAASGDRYGTTPTGEHWYWGCPHHREMVEVAITDVVLLDEHVSCPECGTTLGWLASREQYQGPTWESAHRALTVEEPTPAVALHIQLNDPAYVIGQCERDLKILRQHEGNPGCICLEWMAQAYGIEHT